MALNDRLFDRRNKSKFKISFRVVKLSGLYRIDVILFLRLKHQALIKSHILLSAPV